MSAMSAMTPMSPSNRIAQAARAPWIGVLPIALTFAALAFAAPALADTIEGTVVRVTDGDTVVLKPDTKGDKPIKLRLHGMDAPERCQPGGDESREALSARVLNKHVQATTHAIDDYKRSVATVQLNGEDIGAWMVLQGRAWTHGFKHAPAPYAKQELEARAAKRGLFADPTSQEPRQFRKQHGPCN